MHLFIFFHIFLLLLKCFESLFRGIAYYFVEMECAKADLHSGVFGGTV